MALCMYVCLGRGVVLMDRSCLCMCVCVFLKYSFISLSVSLFLYAKFSCPHLPPLSPHSLCVRTYVCIKCLYTSLVKADLTLSLNLTRAQTDGACENTWLWLRQGTLRRAWGVSVVSLAGYGRRGARG